MQYRGKSVWFISNASDLVVRVLHESTSSSRNSEKDGSAIAFIA